MKMKLRTTTNSIHLPISKHEVVHESETMRADTDNQYLHPWYRHLDRNELKKPNPPSQEAIEKAKFVDKTYVWDGGGGSVRPRDKRSSQ